MTTESVKVSCTLYGDEAIDFERLHMTFKTSSFAPNRSKQHALIISAGMLVLDALSAKYGDQEGKRYPSLEEVLKFAGCRERDIEKLLMKQFVPVNALQQVVESTGAKED